METGDGILMKIAITATTGDLDSEFDSRFGRGANFIIIEADTQEWEAYPNAALNASGGAGVQAAQFVAGHGVKAVISGDFGPKAYSALAAAGILMFLAPAGEALTARELLARYQEGRLKQVSAPTGPGHHAPRGGGRGGH
jgi:predicted Fe-Mo cluster-binding NifX family protein